MAGEQHAGRYHAQHKNFWTLCLDRRHLDQLPLTGEIAGCIARAFQVPSDQRRDPKRVITRS
jgi:hypothetical protein